MDAKDFMISNYEDKIDGLESDLENAVEMVFRYGPRDWVKLNYPKEYEKLVKREGESKTPKSLRNVLIEVRETLVSLAWDENHSMIEKIDEALISTAPKNTVTIRQSLKRLEHLAAMDGKFDTVRILSEAEQAINDLS